MNKVLVKGIVFATALGLAGVAQAQVKIGVMGPITGSAAAFGAQLKNGAEQALSALGFDYLLPNPDLLAELRGHGLYRATDFQVLAGEPLHLAHDTQSNQFTLTFGLRRGTSLLSTFQLLPLTAPQVHLTPEGRVELRFTEPAAEAFYFIEFE